MAIPDFQSCMRPLLAAIEDGQVHHFPAIIEKVAHYFGLTDEERAQLLPSGKQAIFKNRMGWSSTYMKKAGLLVQPQRSHVQITDLGRKALEECPDKINVKYLKQFDSFLEFHTAKPAAPVAQLGNGEEDETTDPVERLEQAYYEIEQQLIDDVLNQVKALSPAFLETLVVQVLKAMGYGGWSSESGSATQYGNDGGIDGVINEDPLGLETIYVQAKRYTENHVHRPELQAFSGALEMKKAKKGVFITTSKFSSGAREFVSMIEKRIILIDGQQLAKLMVEHNVGVTVKETYQVKDIDTDFFTDE